MWSGYGSRFDGWVIIVMVTSSRAVARSITSPRTHPSRLPGEVAQNAVRNHGRKGGGSFRLGHTPHTDLSELG